MWLTLAALTLLALCYASVAAVGVPAMALPSGDTLKTLGAVLGGIAAVGTAILALLGKLGASVTWLFGLKRRRASAEREAFASRGDIIEGMARDLQRVNERMAGKDAEMEFVQRGKRESDAKNLELEQRVANLEAESHTALARLTAEHTTLLASALAERDTRHAFEITGLHDRYRQEIERKAVKYNEDLEEAEHEIAALRARLAGRPTSGPVC